MTSGDGAPRVSVIMANYNGAAHIGPAVRSVLRQTETSLELLVSDDGSSDDSVSRAREAAGDDARLRLIKGDKNNGPGAARNRALDAVRGDWIAIVDNDDFIHPERLEKLLAAAASDGADIVTDNLLTFYQDGTRPPHAHLRLDQPRWINAATYEHSNRLGAKRALGYLKPIFRRTPLRYDESLRIGEDADLILRMLLGGRRLRVYPDLGYFYRKHPQSISHRLSVETIDAMSAAYARLDPGDDAALANELMHGRFARADARAFAHMVAALKARRFGVAVQSAMRRPGAVLLFREALAKRVTPSAQRRPVTLDLPRVTLLSRQRIVGSTNGSSAYVLTLAGALRDAGYAVDYLGASSKIFGRWAVMRLRPEIRVFDRYRVHGGARIGDFIFARDPRVWLAAATAVAARALAKFGLRNLGWSRPAEYAQGAAATPADQVFVAQNAEPGAKAVLCDYAFLAPLAPYALAPEAPALIIMHDLMSARVGEPGEVNAVQISAAAELRLLSLGDAVISIQAEEAALVRAALPRSTILVAPHGVVTAASAQPGMDDTLLFVGSNTDPNILGLAWFFREIWPAIRARRPAAKLIVAGSVARGLTGRPEGVTAIGVVPDLAPFYREAGVVISPLLSGSGLKIKLIEALAAGKAVVATSVTLQGVDDIAGDAICRADEAGAFATAVVALLADKSARAALGSSALACAHAHFSMAAAFAPLTAFLRRAGPTRVRKSLPATASTSQ